MARQRRPAKAAGPRKRASGQGDAQPREGIPVREADSSFDEDPLDALSAYVGSLPGKSSTDPAASFADPPSSLLGKPPAQPMPGLAALNTRLSAVLPTALSSLRTETVDIATQLDPRLQLAIVNRRAGKRAIATSSTAGDEVAVVARVSDALAWNELPEVHPGCTLGRAEDGSMLVTGRVPVARIEVVRAHDIVFSLKASQPVRPMLDATVRVMGVGAKELAAPASSRGGKGVVVGIIDSGGDFAHRNFRTPRGKTRLRALWDQSGVARAGSPFGYGRLYSPAEIDTALAAPDPYSALGYGPRPDSAYEQGAHGTHVMDIAAGNGLGSSMPGVAPQADLVFVEMAASDIAWRGPESVMQSFGDSVQMLEAIRFIFDTAGDRPCVINLSLGTNGGAHDGSSLVEQGIDAMAAEHPDRAVVIAAGNAQLDGIHSSGEVPATGSLDLVWRMKEHGGEVELWCDGPARLRATLLGPDGTAVMRVEPGESRRAVAEGDVTAIFASSRLDDPNNHDNVIGVWLAPGLPAGDWTLRLESLTERAASFHAWIERMDWAQSMFVAPVDTHTLGSISTGRQSVVVGAFDAHKQALPVASFSSSGPTRDGRFKPELSAPGVNVVAARSRTEDGVIRKSGTSMAAPAVTGLVALMFAEARRNGHRLDSEALRKKLIAGVETRGQWDPQLGYGKASAKAI
jgi:subtilisin family serine protease